MGEVFGNEIELGTVFCITDLPLRDTQRRGGKVIIKPKQQGFLTAQEVAVWLGYSTRTITEWAKQYEDSGGTEGLPCFKIGKRAWSFDREKVEKWLADKQNPNKQSVA